MIKYVSDDRLDMAGIVYDAAQNIIVPDIKLEVKCENDNDNKNVSTYHDVIVTAKEELHDPLVSVHINPIEGKDIEHLKLEHSDIKSDPLEIETDCNTVKQEPPGTNLDIQQFELGDEPKYIYTNSVRCEDAATSRKDDSKPSKASKHNRHPCDQCQFVMTTAWNLKQHKACFKHDGTKTDRTRHPCDQCEYSATRTGDLKRHKAAKHEEHRYQCDQCQYVTSTVWNLKLHKASIHDGIKYPCDQCNYAATDQSGLKKHKAKHDGVIYPCEQCVYVATDKSNLRRHKASKHEGKVYPCDICDNTFTRVSHLKSHKICKHPIIST